MKTQFKVINRVTREEQIFNSKEFKRFFHCEYDPQTKTIKFNNQINDYAISLKRTDTEKILLIINCLAVAGTSLYLLSQWI